MKHIVLLLHGYATKRKRYDLVVKQIEAYFPNSEILFPYLGMTPFSIADPDDKVVMAMECLDEAWTRAKEDKKINVDDVKIIIIGHSTGSIIARKTYVVACGQNANAPFERVYGIKTGPREWAPNVDRIILLAGMNRGWTLNYHIYTGTAILMTIGMFVGHIFRICGFEPLAFKTHRGGSFITQLRLQWISMIRHADQKGIGKASIVQLLGTIDDIIGPEDSVDVITGANFIYREVPESNHMTVLRMDNSKSGKLRSKVFEDALTDSITDLKKNQISPSDQAGLTEDTSVTDVVFVIHGIRDTGYWTHKIARRVKLEGDKIGKKFATETSSYGFFGMLPFLFPFVRRRKVEWLMDQYTENVAHYPNAEFSFVGHSNGTYLLSKALIEYPACKFKNVVFAGSVVSTNFNWEEMINHNRISKIFNFIAADDIVVAIFPKFFQMFRLQDLGSAGYDGFRAKLNVPYQLMFVKGGHGSAIKEMFWDEIANFVVYGQPTPALQNMAIPERSLAMKLFGAIAPLFFLILVTAIIFIANSIWKTNPGSPEIIAVLLLYFLAVWWIINKV